MNLITRMILVLVVIGVVSGGGLAILFAWADPIIQNNAKEETKAAIFKVVPKAVAYEKLEKAPFEAYVVYGDAGKKEVVGYALPTVGTGFQGNIKLIIGITPDLNKITAMEVLDQLETPGLGSKITEEDFRNFFNGLSTEKPVTALKGETPHKEKSEIQAITGATISSKAVVKIVNKGMEDMRQLKKEGKI